MAKRKFNPIIYCQNDDLYVEEVGSWSEDKYRLVGGYCDMFTSSMKNKWDNLIYIDLFSGSGYAKLKETGKIVKSSPMIALSILHQFDKYIFCDIDHTKLLALKTRVEKEFPNVMANYIPGDCNNISEEISAEIPKYSKHNTVLSFCFVDPYSLKNFHFNTIKKLSKNGSMRIDFLILLPLHMDGNRNLIYYSNQNNKTIAEFVDDNNWIEDFNNSGYNKREFVNYLYDKYTRKFEELKYFKPKNPMLVRSIDKKLPLYYLSLFSKSKLGIDFFNKVQSYATDQRTLGF